MYKIVKILDRREALISITVSKYYLKVVCCLETICK